MYKHNKSNRLVFVYFCISSGYFWHFDPTTSYALPNSTIRGRILRFIDKIGCVPSKTDICHGTLLPCTDICRRPVCHPNTRIRCHTCRRLPYSQNKRMRRPQQKSRRPARIVCLFCQLTENYTAVPITIIEYTTARLVASIVISCAPVAKSKIKSPAVVPSD